MPFALDSNPDISEVSEAINYLLGNLIGNVSADPNTGQIVGPQGVVVSYLYKYLAIKYADNFNGTVNFSNTPTNRGYYGVRNTNSSVESTSPADYIWFRVAGGFGTTNFLFYQTVGGRAINFVISSSAPDNTYIQDSGISIDLDVLTSGVKANSSTVAYLVLNQSAPAPSGFPLSTSGNSLPAGWSANLGTVAVGQVAWYSFGTYNSSSLPVNGIAANTTYWNIPVAASLFQDIRSDNWNGSTPPNTASPATWGTTGYYISRDDGNIYANGFYARGVMKVNGAVFNPSVGYTTALDVNPSAGSAIGMIGYSNVSGGFGIVGYTDNNSASVGVNGTSTAVGSVGVLANNTAGGFGLDVAGRMKINNNTVVTNLNANFVNGTSVTGIVANGSGTGTYLGTTKPSGTSTNNQWLAVVVSGTTYYIPAWQ